MNESSNESTSGGLSRREFLKNSSTAVAGGGLLAALSGCGTTEKKVAVAAATTAAATHAFAQSGETLKIALIGCGGRGSGAADQALGTSGATKLVAMADAFGNRLQKSHDDLKKAHADKVEVPKENQFVGFEGYKQAISMADVVILATPPGFRPAHFEEAVRQGKHVFMEKPVATDSPGVRKVLAAAEEAKKKNLKVGVGLQRHHQQGYIETIQRLHDGAIGDIVAMRAYWNGSTPWVHTRAELEKQLGRKPTEMEYQMRNWYYFNWLCGDHIVEQHIHNMDVINWVKKGHPIRAQGQGGCEVRKGPDYGEIFDHHFVEFEYPDGSRLLSQCRHINGCWNSVSEHVQGTNGSADISGFNIKGPNAWKFKDKAPNPYQKEHDDLFDAIRNNKTFNEAEYGAISTMTAIFGRMATYSGKMLEWDEAINSQIDLQPKAYGWDAEAPVKPGPDGMYPLAIPGKTIVV